MIKRIEKETLPDGVRVYLQDEYGRAWNAIFDHDPSDQELWDSLPNLDELIPTSKADLEAYMIKKYETWLRWRTTREEGAARGLTQGEINALTARENEAWNDYYAAMYEWYTAE